MKQIVALYKNAYGGLSEAAWMLALVMFINRSGMMILPFLTIYTKESLGFSIERAGIIMGVFGLGSMIGSFLGGWLSDKIGQFKVQFFSLIIGGGMFLFLPAFTEFYSLAVAILVSSIVIECLRPANSASVAKYTKPENVTRAFSLNRMALNLGISIGPAVGGLLATYSYKWLFWGDGITCMIAGLVFFFYFRNKDGKRPEQVKSESGEMPTASPYRDFPFLGFLFLCSLFALVFFQIFNTLPLYYREVYGLSKSKIGGLLGLNGLIVFALEMIMVYLLEKRFKLLRIIILGTLINGISYMLLNLASGSSILYASMFLISIAEILVMPFMITFIVQRAGQNNRGAYLGLYAFSYATAFVASPYLGTQIVSHFSYETLWWILGGISVFTAVGFYLLVPLLVPKKETKALELIKMA